jgi:hypothetical protein
LARSVWRDLYCSNSVGLKVYWMRNQTNQWSKEKSKSMIERKLKINDRKKTQNQWSKENSKSMIERKLKINDRKKTQNQWSNENSNKSMIEFKTKLKL